MKTAFLGGGNMATAIVSGLVAGNVDPASIWVKDPNEEKRNLLSSKYGVNTVVEAGEWLSECDIVVLAVKPQVLKECAMEVRRFIRKDALILSIAAGVTMQTLADWFEHDLIVRAMPNTPALVGMGITGLYVPEGIAPEMDKAAEEILSAVGKVVRVGSEEMIHSITGGSGSGPAYVFLFMEKFAAALQETGLDAAQARELVLGTVEGAAKLARETGEDFSVLRAKVTSKGGTTAKAIEAFEEHDLGGTLKAAVGACIARSKEMSELFK